MLQYLLSFKKYTVRHDILNLCTMTKINKMNEIKNDINKLNEINNTSENKIIEINKMNETNGINNNSFYSNKTKTPSKKFTIKLLFEKFYNMILEEDEILNAVIN